MMTSGTSKWHQAEASARHGVFTFLLIFALVNLDIMARKSKQAQEEATRTWVAWAVIFTILAFFIITPEQQANSSKPTQTAPPVSSGAEL